MVGKNSWIPAFAGMTVTVIEFLAAEAALCYNQSQILDCRLKILETKSTGKTNGKIRPGSNR